MENKAMTWSHVKKVEALIEVTQVNRKASFFAYFAY